ARLRAVRRRLVRVLHAAAGRAPRQRPFLPPPIRKQVLTPSLRGIAVDAVTQVPAPRNEPVLNYAPGSPERAALEVRLAGRAPEKGELTGTSGGEQRRARGESFDVVQPHRHAAVLGTSAHAT